MAAGWECTKTSVCDSFNLHMPPWCGELYSLYYRPKIIIVKPRYKRHSWDLGNVSCMQCFEHRTANQTVLIQMPLVTRFHCSCFRFTTPNFHLLATECQNSIVSCVHKAQRVATGLQDFFVKAKTLKQGDAHFETCAAYFPQVPL